ncbi:MAG: hypothetical protein N3D16_12065, partial [Anaerolineales bacterium]|nr:hypothetical protein [Anaerolineales bacterium]
DQSEQERIKQLSSAEFLQTLHLYLEIFPNTLISLLRNAIALIQLEDEPAWGGNARRALGLGVPVVGFELPSLDEAVGSAGYLVPQGDERSLSAALITLVVEEEVLHSLRRNALQQAMRWEQRIFRKGLLRLYQQAVSRIGERIHE